MVEVMPGLKKKVVQYQGGGEERCLTNIVVKDDLKSGKPALGKLQHQPSDLDLQFQDKELVFLPVFTPLGPWK